MTTPAPKSQAPSHGSAPPLPPVKEPLSPVPPAPLDYQPPPADFKLAKVGSKDYVAGQPIDEKELLEVTAEDKLRKSSRDKPATTHEKYLQQYGPA
jgi:hypothetical protein